MTDWPKALVEWTEQETAYLSVVFTWDLPAAYQRAVFLRQLGYTVKAGGPAVALMPDYLADVAECNGEQMPALKRHNPDATFTSRGCVRHCRTWITPWRYSARTRRPGEGPGLKTEDTVVKRTTKAPEGLRRPCNSLTLLYRYW